MTVIAPRVFQLVYIGCPPFISICVQISPFIAEDVVKLLALHISYEGPSWIKHFRQLRDDSFWVGVVQAQSPRCTYFPHPGPWLMFNIHSQTRKSIEVAAGTCNLPKVVSSLGQTQRRLSTAWTSLLPFLHMPSLFTNAICCCCLRTRSKSPVGSAR